MSMIRTHLVVVSLALLLGYQSPALRAGEDEGIARYVPWSGSYWPIGEGLLISGPLAKYDRATGHRAAAWEYQKNPPGSRVPEWFGYCHAWASAAVMDREPVRLRSAWSIDRRPLYFGIGDQKGMLTACHTADIAQHYGIRYTGGAGEDPNDIYPDQLWRVLKLYLQRQGIPLILDIEEGPEVWNYPVYAYRVAYWPAGPGNQYFAEMSLLMADDAVPPDCVGVKVSKQTYYFIFRLQQGSVVAGSARWVGPSITNHPDFAWYPHTARSENPEINYTAVKRLVDASGSGPATSRPAERPQPRRRPSRVPPATSAASRPAAWGRIAMPANVIPGRSGGTHLSSNSWPELPTPTAEADASEPYVLSPVELLSLVTNRTSAFTLDVTVDKFDGGHYTPDERLTISGTSEKAGYLYLFYLNSEGGMAVLFPYGGIDNQIAAQERFALPAGGAWRAFGAPGTHRIKGVVTSMPLIISGLMPPAEEAAQPRDFQIPPSQRKMFHKILGKHHKNEPIGGEEFGDASPGHFLGEYAQDEVAFYVGPLPPEENGRRP
ncbi:MAG: DUF4384 domain-containing protein [Pirellulaceae bacterium]|nr:DUF4384 domain-containing protein [Pirellulaceae bacterium]